MCGARHSWRSVSDGVSSSWRSVSGGARSSWRTYYYSSYYLLSSSSWRTAQWQRARRAASAASVTAVCAAAVYAVLVLGVLSLITRAFLVSAAVSFSCPMATAAATGTWHECCALGGGAGFGSAGAETEAGPAPAIHYSLGRQTFG